MNNTALFVVGFVVTIPAAAVVIALIFAAGIDEREEKEALAGHVPETALSGHAE